MMKIHKIPATTEEEQFSIYLGTSSLDSNLLLNQKNDFFSDSDCKIFEQFKFDHKRKSFLQSRHLAKSVLSQYLKESDLTKILIIHGIFSQPLVSYETEKLPTLSISHTKTQSACIVSSAKCPTAIDIEAITEKSKENIISQTTPHEREIIKNKEDENTFYTRIWTIKEALSKVLKTGIMSPFNIYEIKDITYYKNYTVSRFSNFNQYHAISCHYEQNILSLVLPSAINSMVFDEISFLLNS